MSTDRYRPLTSRCSRVEIQSPDTSPLSITGVPIYEPLPPEGKESWLISYIDMLTLLVTLFVLLLSYQNSITGENANKEQISSTLIEGTPASVDVTTATTQSAAWQQLLKTTNTDKDNISIEENEENLSVTLKNQLVFQPGEVSIKPYAHKALNDIAHLLKKHPHPTSIAGHTDNTPIQSALYPSNWELSTARATNITRYLIEQGVPETQLRAIGYADTQPNASNKTDKGKANNRRVTITLHLAPENS
ncbi:MAG: OmpA family protein [Gammaproteobacteria bacterium]|nr:OmpA family protein [Gammaproteobacteria bacterium]